MKVVIAEDEFIERKAMKKFIEENFKDFKVVGEAENGRKAIELAETLSPDVILMDMKMPGINGLEAIEKISEKNQHIKFIVISAYDYFSYAKKAMEFGVKNYILKPGKKEEMIKAFLRVKKEIKTERQLQQEIYQSNQWKRERLIEELINHPVSNNVYELRDQLYPEAYGGFFFVIDGEYQKNLLNEQLMKLLDHHFIIYERDELKIVCILTSTDLSKSYLLQLARTLHLALGKNSYIGIGSYVSSLKKLPESYSEAYTAFFQLKLQTNRKYGFAQKDRHLDKDRTSDVIKKICKEIEKGNPDQAVLHYKNHSSLFDSEAKENLYFKVKTLLSAMQVSIKEITLSSLRSEKSWEHFIKICATEMRKMHQSKQYTAKIKSYIHNHYHRELTLQDVADVVGLTPNYVSTLFNQEFGETFTDYLTRLRLQKAKEFIHKNEYTFKEISFMVGFKNANYFSRVFKKVYGKSPKQYQQEIFNK